MAMKKICILHTGGVSAMELNAQGVLEVTSEQQKKLLTILPRLNELAELHEDFLFELDSSDMSPERWQSIADSIAKNYDEYDGFVILHGHDTLAFTATALSFILGHLGKPVILTDTIVPLGYDAPDNHSNIFNAIRFAGKNLAEVGILFGDSLLRGNRSIKTHDVAINAFTSPNLRRLGEVGIDLRLREHCYRRHSDPLILKNELIKDVAVIKLFPGISNEHVLNMVPPRTKGVVIEGYGGGNIPLGKNGIQDAIATIINQDIVVVINTQCMYGGVEYGRYIGGAFAKKQGALSSHDMTSEAAIVKLMWVLGQTENREEIAELYERNLVGELTKEFNQ